jgi:hypothetical protein
MENNLRNTNIDSIQYATVVNENKLLRSSFSWMSLAMLLTTLAAVAVCICARFDRRCCLNQPNLEVSQPCSPTS